MRALVTGGSGFTGSHLVRLLSQGGHRPRALLRSSSRLQLLGRTEFEPFEGDLSSDEDFLPAVEGMDAVFHVAAVYREAKLSDAVYRRVNVEATRLLAEAALAKDIPFLYCSTCGVHGEVAPPASEDSPYNPGDIYQQTKVEAEEVLLEMYHRRGLRVVILRPVGIYGPGDRRFLKLFRGIARRRFPMIGRGEVFYHLTHVEDVARGFIRASEAEGVDGEAFILAGERYTTVKELVSLIAKEASVQPPRLAIPALPMLGLSWICENLCRPFGIEPPLYPRRLDFFLKHRAFTIEKAKTLLGWTPRVDLDEGIRETLAWYKAENWL